MSSTFAIQWGTYNPGTYMGLRAIIDDKNFQIDNLNAGVFWGTSKNIRHQISPDDAVTFAYRYNDPGKFAIQDISDNYHKLNITQTWATSGGNDWYLEIAGEHNGKTKYDTDAKEVSIYFYVTVDSINGDYYIDSRADGMKVRKPDGSEICSIQLADSDENIYTYGAKLPKAETWRVHIDAETQSYTDKHRKGEERPKNPTLQNDVDEKSTLLLVQYVVTAPFNLVFKLNDSQQPNIEALVSEFDEKFVQKFSTTEYTDFTRHVLSNLLGGIGYFAGPIRTKEGKMSGINKLLTCTPSRSNFPRGFLWDEGYHQLIVCEWNQSLCIKMVESWANTMNKEGWIAREQIRGYEAEARVPAQFIPQDSEVANPPTMLLAVEKLAGRMRPELRDTELGVFLKNILPKFKKWAFWFQEMQVNEHGYPSWKGRTLDHTLASGLDDYPRGVIISDKERHIDVFCWQSIMFNALKKIALSVGDESLGHVFEIEYESLQESLDDFFPDHRDWMGDQYVIDINGKMIPGYFWRGDNKCGEENKSPLGLAAECNPYSDSPCCSEYGWCGNSNNHCNCPKCVRSIPLEKRKGIDHEEVSSPHIGYVSLFPLIAGLSTGDKLEQVLDEIRDPDILWSEHGLRSLSASDMLYKSGENYWRGHIWMNINYLVLRALNVHYSTHPRAQEIYTELRTNLINTVHGSWESTGTLWEQYNDETGKGQRIQPFYGWSSLVLLIIEEIY